MGENRSHAHSVGRDRDRLTIADAAALLGVHKNTVRNRIKTGVYRAELVQTERGPTYLIERESLLTDLNTSTLSSASQEVVSTQAMEFVQELLRPFVSELGEVREELGAERARRHVAEERVAWLEAELEASRQRQESHEMFEEEPEKEEPTSYAEEDHEAPQEASEDAEASEEQQGRGAPQSATAGAQEPAETVGGRGSGTMRGSLWRRIFGR